MVKCKKYRIKSLYDNKTVIDSSYGGSEDIIMMPVYAPIQKADLNQYTKRTLELFYENMIKENKMSLDDIINQVELETIPITIPKGTRLCQLEILPVMPDVNFVDTKREDWRKENRSGFGSTGK